MIIQSFWRRILSWKELNLRFIQKISAIKIQATFRGSKARIWVAEWKRKKTLYAIRCQAHLRRRLDSKRWAKVRNLEYACALSIQSSIRSFLSKCLLRKLLKDRAASIIQMFYRTLKTKSRVLHHKLYKDATVIQSHIRLFICKQRFSILSVKKHAAAEIISRCWRGHEARRTRTKLLRERNLERKENFMRTLLADERYFLASASLSSNHSDSPEESGKGYSSLMSELERLESDLSVTETQSAELKKSLAQMTPRSVEQGWEEQTKRGIKNMRNTTTKLKHDIIFNVKRNIKQKEMQDRREKEEMAQLNSFRALTKDWLEEMIKEVWAGKRIHARRTYQRTSRQAIADEKRRWKVDLKTASGKPLKSSKELKKENDFTKEYHEYGNLIERISQQRFFNQLEQYKGIYKQN